MKNLLEKINTEKVVDYTALTVSAVLGVVLIVVAAAVHLVAALCLETMGTALNKLKKKEEGMFETSYIDMTPIDSIMSIVDIVVPFKSEEGEKAVDPATVVKKTDTEDEMIAATGGNGLPLSEEPPKFDEKGDALKVVDLAVSREKDANASKTVVTPPETTTEKTSDKAESS